MQTNPSAFPVLQSPSVRGSSEFWCSERTALLCGDNEMLSVAKRSLADLKWFTTAARTVLLEKGNAMVTLSDYDSRVVKAWLHLHCGLVPAPLTVDLYRSVKKLADYTGDERVLNILRFSRAAHQLLRAYPDTSELGYYCDKVRELETDDPLCRQVKLLVSEIYLDADRPPGADDRIYTRIVSRDEEKYRDQEVVRINDDSPPIIKLLAAKFFPTTSKIRLVRGLETNPGPYKPDILFILGKIEAAAKAGSGQAAWERFLTLWTSGSADVLQNDMLVLAASRGRSEAMCRMAMAMWLTDRKTAQRLLRKASKLNHGLASILKSHRVWHNILPIDQVAVAEDRNNGIAYYLAALGLDWIGEPAAESIACFRKAARLGVAEAQYRILTTAKSKRERLCTLQALAETGDEGACLTLGEQGDSRFLSKLADAGHAKACYLLGLNSRDGTKYHWLQRAMLGGYPGAAGEFVRHAIGQKNRADESACTLLKVDITTSHAEVAKGLCQLADELEKVDEARLAISCRNRACKLLLVASKYQLAMAFLVRCEQLSSEDLPALESVITEIRDSQPGVTLFLQALTYVVQNKQSRISALAEELTKVAIPHDFLHWGLKAWANADSTRVLAAVCWGKQLQLLLHARGDRVATGSFVHRKSPVQPSDKDLWQAVSQFILLSSGSQVASAYIPDILQGLSFLLPGEFETVDLQAAQWLDDRLLNPDDRIPTASALRKRHTKFNGREACRKGLSLLAQNPHDENAFFKSRKILIRAVELGYYEAAKHISDTALAYPLESRMRMSTKQAAHVILSSQIRYEKPCPALYYLLRGLGRQLRACGENSLAQKCFDRTSPFIRRKHLTTGGLSKIAKE